MKRILVLGAGRVIDPLLTYLGSHGFHLTVGTISHDEAAGIRLRYPKIETIHLDVTDRTSLVNATRKADLVASFVPWIYHGLVSMVCVELGKHLVTSSYVQPEMLELHKTAQEKGLVLFNEIGLDPGIDHMSAMKLIAQGKRDGGTIEYFRSDCGGLPEPKSADNPLRYKFSWSPRGVVLAAKNPARYIEDGQIVDVPGGNIFNRVWPLEIPGLGSFEVYPNRDSTKYMEKYGLLDPRTFIRGTIRYKGWSETWRFLIGLGYIDEDTIPDPSLTTYHQIFDHLHEHASQETKNDAIKNPSLLKRFEGLGLRADDPIPKHVSLLDILTERLTERLCFAKKERDMILLRHTIIVRKRDGRAEEFRSLLVQYGDPDGPTAMAKTVSLPAAIAIRMILENRIKARGIVLPLSQDIYDPILTELASHGIRFNNL